MYIDVRAKIPEEKGKGSFEESRSHSIREYKVSGTTVKGRLFPSDEKDRYFHIYYSDVNVAQNENSWKKK